MVRLIAAAATAALLAGCSTMESMYGSVVHPAPAKTYEGALVGANDMTLYTFDRDPAGTGRSVCNGPCAANWPPLYADGGAARGDWTVIRRDDGRMQWAYKGKPLYFYQPDQKAGDRSGDNFKDVWHIVKE